MHAGPAGYLTSVTEPSDDVVDAVGKLTEGLEYLERARGHLYSFHQLMGRADLLAGEAAEMLRDTGNETVAERLESELVGRNVLEGRWTFQIVEEFEETYWEVFRENERRVREELVGGARHLHESRMKEDRRTEGRKGHESRP